MATFDAHANLALATVAVAPSPALSGTSLIITAGFVSLFPAVPFNCTVWPSTANPTDANAEIVRVTNIVGDIFTIVRAQEGTTAKAIASGYRIGNTVTAKVFTDIENQAIFSISAGTTNATGNQIVFANSNNISFGASNNSITASFAGGGGGAAISAGANSQSTGTVVFSNSNGISFGLNAGTLTAAHNALTAQSTQPVAASASNGSFAFSTLGFSNANGVTFGTSAGSIITASVGTAAAGNSVNFSAGTTSNDLGSIVFSNSNNISFGLNGSTLTASHEVSLNEILDPSADALILMNTRQIQFQWGSNLTAFTTNAARQGLFEIDVIGGTNFATDSTTHAEVLHIHQSSNNPYLHLIHLQADGTNAIPMEIQAAGSIGLEINKPIFFDGGSVPMILGTSQSNLVSNLNAFYLEGARSSQFLTSQSNQAASASNGSFTFQTLGFSNANNVTFGTSAGSIITASVAAAGGGSINFSAGTTSNDLNSIVFSNSNGVTFGLSGSTVTASVSVGAGAAVTLSQFTSPELFAPGAAQAFNVSANSMSFGNAFILPQAVSFNYVRLLVAMSNAQTTAATLASASATASAAVFHTFNVVFYTFGTGASSEQLQSVASGSAASTFLNSISISNSTQASYTLGITAPVTGGSTFLTTQYSISNTNYSFTSNSIGSLFSGNRMFDVPLNTVLPPGNYWVLAGRSSSSASAGPAGLSNISNNRVDMTGFYLCTQSDISPIPMGVTDPDYAYLAGASFTTNGGGTLASLNFSDMTKAASNRRVYFQLQCSS
jgi:hypothetical protein